MAPSELSHYRHLFIRPLPEWIIQNMLKVVLYLTYGNIKLHTQCLHISVYIKSGAVLKTRNAATGWVVLLVLGILIALLCVVLDVSILGNQSVEFHVTPVFCSVAASCSHYVPHRRRKLVLVNADFMVRFCWYLCVCQTNGTLALSGGKASWT